MASRLETERLILRQWKREDYPDYARLNADPTVMMYFPAVLSRQESEAQAARITQLIAENGWGFWAAELKATGQFIGFVGLHRQDELSGIPNAPFIEIGWRLAKEYWGKGYAPEAARRALQFAFEQLSAPSIYAFTALPNTPSQRVMDKIGMTNIGQDFDHPKLPVGHHLRRHCLYQVTRETWLGRLKPRSP
ncbi:N-acetyltransferase [Photobacterium gaetbulicola]|uniref:Putative acetyltransferase n=1 Tax=Photobacterium gaetbulicola Gung47 TaxID=658445 RepID=A0A0C5WM96_9GAMM|nr:MULTISPECIES: GNAT family N-acetyltransferase [Photobacterium]AJR06189.1 putative acetyltransferase [Photobacterium gaetbulicola Gung47]PST99534.1 N-acetyltransferase [Photobacterium gaetbulicola]WEM45393.1 GNAT family N-acetyltransferase [Photobacterium sp. DA100]